MSDKWNSYRNHLLINEYNESVQHNTSNSKQLFNQAKRYNQHLHENTTAIITTDKSEQNNDYESILNPNNDGMIGYIEIPKIDIKEPIYHNSDVETLEKGIGHIKGSSFPVDDSNSHTILTGHRGLPNKKIFTDLDKLTVNDCFYIHILDRVFAYRVYSIETVLPYEVENLTIENNRNLVTLVTCTPYGVNTHRLLVKAEKIPFDDTNINDLAEITEQYHFVVDASTWVLIGFLVFIIILLTVSLIGQKKNKNKGCVRCKRKYIK